MTNPMRKLRVVHQEIDRLVDAYTTTAERHGRGSVSCTKGCSHCCYMLNTIAPVEAVIAVSSLLHGKRTGTPGGVARWERFETRVKELLPGQVKAVLRDDARIETWWAERRRCVFLDDDNTCSVYEHRPGSCRTHVVSSNPDECGKREASVTLVLDLSEVDHFWMEHLCLDEVMAEALGVPSGVAPLPIAVHWMMIAVLEGIDVLQEKLRGTVFEDPGRAMAYWTKLEMSPEGNTYLMMEYDGRPAMQCRWCKAVTDDSESINRKHCPSCDRDLNGSLEHQVGQEIQKLQAES